MCGTLFGKSIKSALQKKLDMQTVNEDQPAPEQSGGGGGAVPGLVQVNPAPTATPSQPAAGVQTAQSRIAGREALDNVGVTAGEADVSVASDGSDAELDPSTGRRRPTRASFMSQARGGAGLKV